jgi:hypothetical protein
MNRLRVGLIVNLRVATATAGGKAEKYDQNESGAMTR